MQTYTRKNARLLVKNSDIYGFATRLKKYGFRLNKAKYAIYKNADNTYYHQRTIVSFVTKNKNERVIFTLGRYNYRLRIFYRGKLKQSKTSNCWSHLEKPFLHYFSDAKPLKLRVLNAKGENKAQG